MVENNFQRGKVDTMLVIKNPRTFYFCRFIMMISLHIYLALEDDVATLDYCTSLL